MNYRLVSRGILGDVVDRLARARHLSNSMSAIIITIIIIIIISYLRRGEMR